MIAGRGRHEPDIFTGAFLELQRRVQRATNFEGARRLDDLELEKHLGAGQRRQPVGTPERRSQDEALQPAACRDDVIDRRQD
jgi:hypothetical protein